MAGAGYKLFATGDVLTAAQVNTYLQEQTVMVFADATARTTALSGVLSEGMVTYLKDTNVVEVYDGSAWIGTTGDITGVTATSPLTGGGTTGAITVGIQDGTTSQKGAVQLEDSTSSTSTTKAATPNSVKSAYDLANGAIAKSLVDAKGDLIVASGADAVDRLAVGTDGYVLTADAASTNGIKWATVSGGGMTSIASASFSTSVSTVTISSIPGTYNELWIHVDGFRASSDDTLRVRANGVTSSVSFASTANSGSNQAFDGGGCEITQTQDNGAANGFVRIIIPNYAKTSWKILDCIALTNDSATNTKVAWQRTLGGLNITSAITSITLYTGSGNNFGAGSYTIYGVK